MVKIRRWDRCPERAMHEYNEPNVDYIIIVNGNKCSVDFQGYNVKVIFRENIGYDFGAYTHALEIQSRPYDYYIFMNSSVRGPFGCANDALCHGWPQKFISLISDDVKLDDQRTRSQRARAEHVFRHGQGLLRFFEIDDFFARIHHVDLFRNNRSKGDSHVETRARTRMEHFVHGKFVPRP